MSVLTDKSAGLRRLRGNGVLLLAGVLVLAISIVAAIGAGAVAIPGGTVFKILANGVMPDLFAIDWSKGREAIVWEIRFPRALLAGFVGAGLAVVGAALQSVTRNPLADPHLLGISSGAAAGAILALLHTGLFLGLMTVPLMAFAGALAATFLVLGVTRFASATSADRLVLAGVAVSFIIMAIANILIFLGDPRATHTVVFWMLGGLGLAQWAQLPFPLGILLLVAPYFLLRSAWRENNPCSWRIRPSCPDKARR